MLQELMTATPGQIKTIVGWVKRRKGDIQNQTKTDFTKTIKAYEDAGVKMGKAIVNGFQDADVAGFFDKWVRKRFPGIISAAVNEAVTQWKEAHPPPEAPEAPERPTRPGPRPVKPVKPGGATREQPGGAGTPSTTNNDNSRNFTFYQYISMGDTGGLAGAPNIKEMMRRAAMEAKNAVNRTGPS
jgi:hypothetical protein